MELRASVLLGHYGNIDLGPVTPFPEPGERLDVLDLWSCAKTGPKGPSPASGDTSVPLVLAYEEQYSEPGSPKPRLGDMLRLQPGTGRPSPESGGLPDRG